MNGYDSIAYQLGALDQPAGFRLDGLADRIASALHFTDTSVFDAGPSRRPIATGSKRQLRLL